MCRLLVVKSTSPFACEPHLWAFAHIAAHSPEYQGHGWGWARLDGHGYWHVHRSIRPIWEDDLASCPDTTLLIAHARSAFRNQGIAVENNMPFHDKRCVFAFNGELHGVRLRQPGRTGAEKIFNLIRRGDRGDLRAALATAAAAITRHTRYVRAMNIVLSDGYSVHVHSAFNEDPDYFTLFTRSTELGFIVCSQPYAGGGEWTPIPNHTLRTFT
ncbi:MAG: class II glutamine amidotransferase [Phycisphaerae bacterium]